MTDSLVRVEPATGFIFPPVYVKAGAQGTTKLARS